VKLDRNILVLAALGVAIFVFLGLIFRPLRNSIAFHREEINSKRIEITNTMALGPKFAELREQRIKIQEYLSQHSALLPKAEAIPGVLGLITSIASECDIRILDFTPQPRVDLRALGQTQLSLKASGSFSGIHQFTNRLEQLEPGIWIRGFTVARNKQGVGVSTQINLVIFSSEIDIADLSAR